jgi:hypothetical protein
LLVVEEVEEELQVVEVLEGSEQERGFLLLLEQTTQLL